MTTSKKSKLITLILTALTALAILLGALVLAFPKKPLEAVNRFITVSKVNRLVNGPDNFYTDETPYKKYNYITAKNAYETVFGKDNYSSVFYNGEDHYYTHIKDYSNGDFVMLNNANLENIEGNYCNAENLLIEFTPPNDSISFAISSVTLTLNGQKIYSGSEDNIDWTHAKNQKYFYLIDLHNLNHFDTSKNFQKGNPIAYNDAQGKLTISVSYRVVTASGQTQEQSLDEMTIYLVNEEAYISSLTDAGYSKATVTSYNQLTTETLINYINSNKTTWGDFITNAADEVVYKYTVGQNGGEYSANGNFKKENTDAPFTNLNDFFTGITYIANDNYIYNIYGYNKINSTVEEIVENKSYEQNTYYYLKGNKYSKITEETTPTSDNAYEVGQSALQDLYLPYSYLNYYNEESNNYEYHIYTQAKDGYYELVDYSNTFEIYQNNKPQKDTFLLNVTKIADTVEFERKTGEGVASLQVIKNVSDLYNISNKNQYIYYTTNNIKDGTNNFDFNKYESDDIDNYFIKIESKEFITTDLLKPAADPSKSIIPLYYLDGGYEKETDASFDSLGKLYNNFESSTNKKYYVCILDLASDTNSTHANRNYYHGTFTKYLESINNIAGGHSNNTDSYFNEFLKEHEGNTIFNYDNKLKKEDEETSIYTYNELSNEFDFFKLNNIDSYFVPINNKDVIHSDTGLYKKSTSTNINITNRTENKVKIFTKDGTDYKIDSTDLNDIWDWLNDADPETPAETYYYCILDNNLRDKLRNVYYIGETYYVYPRATAQELIDKELLYTDESRTTKATGSYSPTSLYYIKSDSPVFVDDDINPEDSPIRASGMFDNTKTYYIETPSAEKLNTYKNQNQLFHSTIEASSGTYFANKLQIGLTKNTQEYKFYKSILDSNIIHDKLFYKVQNEVLTDGTKPLSDAFNKYNILAQINNYNNNTNIATQETTLPILANTEKIYYQNDKNNTEVNYFNYSNENITNYLGKAVQDKADIHDIQQLQYPTYYWDATKYNLSYTYTVNNEVLDTVTTQVVYNKQKACNTLLITHNPKNKQAYVEEPIVLPSTNIAELKFTNIGLYNFTIKLVTTESANNYVTDQNNTALEEQFKYLHNTKLYIYGYQLFYTNYSVTDSYGNTTLSELKKEEITADISTSVDKILSTYKEITGTTKLENLTGKVNELINQYGTNVTFYYVYNEDMDINGISTPNTKYIEVPIFKELTSEIYYNLSPELSERVFTLINEGLTYQEIEYNKELPAGTYYKVKFDEVTNGSDFLVETYTNTYKTFDNLIANSDYINNVYAKPGDFITPYVKGSDNYLKATDAHTAYTNSDLFFLKESTERTVEGDLLTTVECSELTDLSELQFTDLIPTGTYYKLGDKNNTLINEDNIIDNISNGITNSPNTTTLINYLHENGYYGAVEEAGEKTLITGSETELPEFIYSSESTLVTTLADIGVYSITNNAGFGEFDNTENLAELTKDTFITTDNTITVIYLVTKLFDTDLRSYKYFTLDSGKTTGQSIASEPELENLLETFFSGTTTIYKTKSENINGLLAISSDGTNFEFSDAIEAGNTYYVFGVTDKSNLWYKNGIIYSQTKMAPFNGLATTNNLDTTDGFEGFFYKDGYDYKHYASSFDTVKTYYELQFTKDGIIMLKNGEDTYYSITEVEDASFNIENSYYLMPEQKNIYTAKKSTETGIARLEYTIYTGIYNSDLQYWFPTSAEPSTETEYYQEGSNISDYTYINVNKNNIDELLNENIASENANEYIITTGKETTETISKDGFNNKFIKITNYQGQDTNYYYYNYLAYLCNSTTNLPDTIYYTIKNNLEETVLSTNTLFDTARNNIQKVLRDNLKTTVTSDADNIVRTNQAPISTKFMANLMYGEDDNYVYLYSFADYFENKEKLTNNEVKETINFNNSTTFNKNGYYVVYLLYAFDNYSYYDGINLISSAEGANKKLGVQVFVFENRKSQPNITAYENETFNTLSSGSYTNKGLTIKFNEEPSPFDIEPYAKVTVTEKSYNSTQTSDRPTIYAKQSILDSLDESLKAGCSLKAQNDFEFTLDTNDNSFTEYKVEIFYGANWTSSTTRYYTVDKQAISEISANQVIISNNNYTLKNNKLDENNKFTTAYYDKNGVLRTDGFTLNWALKPSGSKIDVSYKYIKLEEENNLQNIFVKYDGDTPKFYIDGTDTEIDLNSFYLNNGYTLKTVSDVLPYTDSGVYSSNGSIYETVLGYTPIDYNDCKWNSETYYYFDKSDEVYYSLPKDDYGTTDDKSTVYRSNINSVLTQSGIYIFTLKDSAGNKSNKVLFLDNSAPTVLYAGISDSFSKLINTSDETKDDIVSDDLLVFWAKGKNIPVVYNTINASLNSEEIEALTKFLGKTEEDVNEFIQTTVNDVEWKFEHISNTSLNKDYQSLNYGDVQNGYKIYSLNNKKDNLFTFEGYHTFNVLYNITKGEFPNSDCQIISNTSFQIMLNTDNSKLTIYTVEDTTSYTEQSFINLKQNHATNRNGVILTWQDSTDNTNYIVESVKYSYFPFSFDKHSANYPFASAPTSKDIMLYELGKENKNVIINANKKATTIVLNELSNKTREGVYVITRTYKEGSVSESSNDTLIRTYYFYVDRHGIIETISADFNLEENHPTLLGEFINILLTASEESALDSILGKDIISDPYTNSNQEDADQNAYFITTNKLPLIAYVLDNKYLANSDLTKLITLLNLTTKFGSYYKDDSDNYFKIKTFTTSTIELQDGRSFKLAENADKIYLQIKEDDLATPTNDAEYKQFNVVNASQNLNGYLLYKNENNEYVYYSGYNYLNAFDIEYKLYKYTQTYRWESEYTGFIKEEGSLTNALKEEGTYKLVITDKSGYTLKRGATILENIDATNLTFYFTINTDAPDADVVKVTENSEQILNESNSTVSTNSKNIKLVWNENSGFMAQINKTDITIELSALNGDKATFKYGYVENKNEVELINSNIALLNNNTQNLSKLFKFNNPTSKDWDYELELFILNNSLFDLSYYKENQINVTLKVTVQFEGQEEFFINLAGKSFFKNILTINLDYTPPTQIYNYLKDSDKYYQSLNNEQKENFDNYQSLISFDNYAFIKNIDDNKLILSSTESRAIYFREYDKYSYTDSYKGLQSLVENDPRFDKESEGVETARIRYVEGANSNLFTNVNKIGNLFTLNVVPNKFYEIIEIDTAGNYRVYTVYTIDNDNEFKVEALYDGSTNSLQLGGSAPTANSKLEIATADDDFGFQDLIFINQENSYDWFDIVITNKNTNEVYNLTYSPINLSNQLTYKNNVEYFNNETLLVGRMNEICKHDTGAGYDIEFFTGIGKGVINLRFKGDVLNFEQMFTNTNNSITLTIDKSKTNLYLKELTITKYKDRIESDKAKITFEIDSYTLKLKSTLDETTNTTNFVEIDTSSLDYILIKITGSDDGDYWFEASDNFNETYAIQQFIGLQNLNEYSITGSYKVFEISNAETDQKIDGVKEATKYKYKQIFVYYTGTVNYKFEPRIYKANIYETPIKLDDNTYSFDTLKELTYDEYAKIYQNGICSYTATPNANMLIDVYNNRGYLAYQYVFVYYSVVNQVNLNSSTGDPLTDLMKETEQPQLTSKFITIEVVNNKFVDINGIELNTVYNNKSIYDYKNNSEDSLATFEYLYENKNFITNRNGVNISDTIIEITYTNLDGVTITYLAENGTQLKECGLYNIKIYNSVGFVFKNYKIELIETVNSYYNVISGNKVLNGFSYNSGEVLSTDEDDDGNYTIYYSTNANYIIEVNSDSSKGINCEEVNQITVDSTYKIYKLSSSKPSAFPPLFFIVAIVNNNSKSYHAENIEYKIVGGIEYTPILDAKTNTITPLITTQEKNGVELKIKSTFGEVQIFNKNFIDIEYYFNEVYVGKLNYLSKGIDGFTYYDDTEEIEELKNTYVINLTESGIYKFRITDQTGKVSYFGDSEFLTVSLENNVLFSINGKTPIDNAVFNSAVTLTLLKTTIYNSLTVDLVATLNNKNYEYKLDATTNTYTFSGYGVYSVKMTYVIDSTHSIVTNYVFTILNPNEASHTYSYLAPNGYEIIKVEKLQGNMYSDVTSYYSRTSVNLTFDTDTTLVTYNGAGRYKITVKKLATSLAPSLIFTYEVWINSAEPYVKINVKDGESTRSDITITIDINSIYKELGECYIDVNGKGGHFVKVNKELIDAYTNEDGKVRNLILTVTETGSYITKIYTQSGNTLYVYNFTKKNSLNTWAIVFIVFAIAVIGLVIFLFFKMRRKMTVR